MDTKLILRISIALTCNFLFSEAFADNHIADEKAIDAYQVFAENWEEFERNRHQEFNKSLNLRKKNLDTSESKDRRENTKKQIEYLTNTIKIYRKASDPKSTTITGQFNLLVAYTQLGELQKEISTEEAQHSFYEALQIAEDIQKNNETENNRPILSQTIYISALIQDRLNNTEAAINSLSKLTDLYQTDIVSIYALMTLGDISYNRARFGDAMRFYQEAQSRAEKLKTVEIDPLQPKILYRLSWASFKSDNISITLETIAKLWRNYHWGQGFLDVRAVSADAIFLLSSSLYSRNSNPLTSKFLSYNLPISSSVIARLMALQTSSGFHDKAIFSGESCLKTNSLSKETPLILNYLANSYHVSGNAIKAEEYLERLALILPPKSLWRTQFHKDLEQINQMEKLSEAAALKLAASFYSNGLVSGNPKSFQKAESMYRLLITSLPTDSRSPDWKLKIAHSNFFAKKYDKAFTKYKDTIEDSELSPEQLKLALYQSVMAAENAWRILLSQLSTNGQNLQKSEELLQLAHRVENSVNHYVERFPQDSRSIDLLLVAASVHRDMENYDRAQKLCERVLVLEANSSQRALAIRGILYAKIKTSSPRDIIESAFNFLKLEQWSSMDPGLYLELNGTLSTALLAEADRLRSEGLVAEAGRLLTEIASVTPDLPEREKILRDGAYFFGIAGQWLQAEQSAIKYLNSRNKKFKDDMQYLLARATEYQLKVAESALAYFELAKNYPEHSKAAVSLDRAKTLADAESLEDLKLRIANLKLERSRNNDQKIRSIDDILEILIKQDLYNDAEKLARSRLRLSNNLEEKYRSRYKLATIAYLSGSKQDGLDELKILDRQVSDNKSKLKVEQYKILLGEINLFRAKHYQNAMQDINLNTSSDTQRSINQKADLFAQSCQFYEKVIAQSDGALVAQARYEMAYTAESLANQIAGIYIRSELTTKLIARTRNKETIQRLHNLAQSQYAKNVLMSRQNPGSDGRSQWVLLSQSRLNSNPSQSVSSEYEDIPPIASYGGIISQWDTKTTR
jgi:hypothetical protein